MLGVSLPLVCNMFLVVCFFVVRAREADRRAGLALRGVCWERGWLACDTYGASLWLHVTDLGRHRGVACIGCLPGAQELA